MEETKTITIKTSKQKEKEKKPHLPHHPSYPDRLETACKVLLEQLDKNVNEDGLIRIQQNDMRREFDKIPGYSASTYNRHFKTPAGIVTAAKDAVPNSLWEKKYFIEEFHSREVSRHLSRFLSDSIRVMLMSKPNTLKVALLFSSQDIGDPDFMTKALMHHKDILGPEFGTIQDDIIAELIEMYSVSFTGELVKWAKSDFDQNMLSQKVVPRLVLHVIGLRSVATTITQSKLELERSIAKFKANTAS